MPKKIVIIHFLSTCICVFNLPTTFLQISKAYLDKSIETDEIKYAAPEERKSSIIINNHYRWDTNRNFSHRLQLTIHVPVILTFKNHFRIS